MIRMGFPAWCPRGQKPLIAGSRHLQRLVMVLSSRSPMGATEAAKVRKTVQAPCAPLRIHLRGTLGLASLPRAAFERRLRKDCISAGGNEAGGYITVGSAMLHDAARRGAARRKGTRQSRFPRGRNPRTLRKSLPQLLFSAAPSACCSRNPPGRASSRSSPF